MPPKQKSNSIAQRKVEAEQLAKKQRKRQIIWVSTVAVLLALIVVVLAIDPKPAPKVVSFDYDKLAVLGSEDAPVKIVEFGDFKCPACKNANDLIKPKLVSDYIDQGKVAFYFMNLPFIGPDSNTAALATQSVYHLNKEDYWTYFDAIYNNQGDETKEWATPDFLVELAKQANLSIDYDQLKKDIEEKTYQAEVDEQYAKGDSLGISSTPTFFINGVQYTESLGDYAKLQQAIEDASKGE
ncbi:Disulfide bond formation protein D precursor [compost metagenome]